MSKMATWALVLAALISVFFYVVDIHEFMIDKNSPTAAGHGETKASTCSLGVGCDLSNKSAARLDNHEEKK